MSCVGKVAEGHDGEYQQRSTVLLAAEGRVNGDDGLDGQKGSHQEQRRGFGWHTGHASHTYESKGTPGLLGRAHTRLRPYRRVNRV